MGDARVEDHDAYRVAAAWTMFTASLSFGDLERDLTEHTVVGSFGMDLGSGWSMALSAGAILDGSFEGGVTAADVKPGWLAGVSATWNAVEADGGVPFLDISFAFAAGGAKLRLTNAAPESLFAVDLRLGLTVGWRLWDVWTPYLAVRAFGGPIWWETGGDTRAGTDPSHLQLAVGSTFTIPGGLLVFGEYAPAFERGVSAGIGAAF